MSCACVVRSHQLHYNFWSTSRRFLVTDWGVNAVLFSRGLKVIYVVIWGFVMNCDTKGHFMKTCLINFCTKLFAEVAESLNCKLLWRSPLRLSCLVAVIKTDHAYANCFCVIEINLSVFILLSCVTIACLFSCCVIFFKIGWQRAAYAPCPVIINDFQAYVIKSGQ